MQRVSVKEVAVRAGVSVGSVSNFLNRPERVSREVRERVSRAIDELGYVRNEAGRRLRLGASSMIGLILPDARNPFFADVAQGVEAAAAEQGLAVLTGHSNHDSRAELAYAELFQQQQVRGILVSPVGKLSPRFGTFMEHGTPVVLIDRPSSELPAVWANNVVGGRLAVEHLLAQGRRRIAFVGGPPETRQVADRTTGAKEAIGDAALEIIGTDGLTVLEGRSVGEKLLERPPGERPDGIFTANDLVAIGLLQALVMRGTVRVPEDIAIVGYDDIDFAAAAVVPLSSIRQPSVQLGRSAVELLTGRAGEGEDAAQGLTFEPTLVERASSLG